MRYNFWLLGPGDKISWWKAGSWGQSGAQCCMHIISLIRLQLNIVVKKVTLPEGTLVQLKGKYWVVHLYIQYTIIYSLFTHEHFTTSRLLSVVTVLWQCCNTNTTTLRHYNTATLWHNTTTLTFIIKLVILALFPQNCQFGVLWPTNKSRGQEILTRNHQTSNILPKIVINYQISRFS